MMGTVRVTWAVFAGKKLCASVEVGSMLSKCDNLGLGPHFATSSFNPLLKLPHVVVSK